jgi:hypothetical protein
MQSKEYVLVYGDAQVARNLWLVELGNFSNYIYQRTSPA